MREGCCDAIVFRAFAQRVMWGNFLRRRYRVHCSLRNRLVLFISNDLGGEVEVPLSQLAGWAKRQRAHQDTWNNNMASGQARPMMGTLRALPILPQGGVLDVFWGVWFCLPSSPHRTHTLTGLVALLAPPPALVAGQPAANALVLCPEERGARRKGNQVSRCLHLAAGGKLLAT